MIISNRTLTTVHKNDDFVGRRKFLLIAMLTSMVILSGRAIYLQILNKSFFQEKVDSQHINVVDVSAYRGQIQDRNGEPLAISTPVQSIRVNTKQLKDFEKDKIMQMAKILSIPELEFQAFLSKEAGKRNVYVKKQIDPDLAEKVKNLGITGVYFEKGFKRFYPAGPISAHLLGFTDINDVGQLGLEDGYEQSLRGKTGKKRVVKDGKGQIIKDIEYINAAEPGQNLTLTIDQRLQYLAYRELQNAVIANKAQSASLVVLDAKNGDVLAIANQPAFNPNNRKELLKDRIRNRAITDSFEPGSTVKPLVVAAALDGGYIDPHVLIETHGVFPVGHNLVKDHENYGTMDLTQILQKSSNVGISQVALTMPAEYFWNIYSNLGFGVSAGVGFPRETSGALLDYQSWNEFAQASIAFGYGLSTSILQLAKAYTAIADDGIIHSVTLLKRDEDPDSKRIFKAETAKKVREMLEHVISKEGTGYQARVEGYRVAGKTGTVKKAIRGVYADDKYFSVFVGMAPASNPRFIIAVVIDEPSNGQYYGGAVAAPIFSKVMAGTLRLYGVEPDHLENMHLLLSKR